MSDVPRWEVITVFTRGHCAIDTCADALEAEALARSIAVNGFVDMARREIVPASHIGSVYWKLAQVDHAPKG